MKQNIPYHQKQYRNLQQNKTEMKYTTNKTKTTYTRLNDRADLDGLLDYILSAPADHLPAAEETRAQETPKLLSPNLNIFCNNLKSQYLEPLCERVELSGDLRVGRVFRSDSFRLPLVDYVVTPHGYDGTDASLQDSPFLGFLRCYQLICCDGGVPLRRRFASGLGLYCCSFLTVSCRLRLWLAPRERFGAVWLLTTGPRAHLSELSLRARRLGHAPLMPAGLYTSAHQWICAAEADIYHALGLEWIAPRKRLDPLFRALKEASHGDRC